MVEKPFGFVVIDKPRGITSHDCIYRMRKVYGIKKIGHSGTLDPNVTGVLPIAIGKATRLIPYLNGSKVYQGIIQLGSSTSTDDNDGEIIISKKWSPMSKLDLNRILDEFRGLIQQKPPRVSSVHINGERAYKKARNGEKFELPTKNIIIYKLRLLNWSQEKGQLEIEVECSSGTYIRSLARDIGEKIKCGGHLLKLRRTASQGFTESQAIDLPCMSSKDLSYVKPKILDPLKSLSHLTSLSLEKESSVFDWRMGKKLTIDKDIRINPHTNIDQLSTKGLESNLNKYAVIINNNNEIEGIGEIIEGLTCKPKVVLNAIG